MGGIWVKDSVTVDSGEIIIGLYQIDMQGYLTYCTNDVGVFSDIIYRQKKEEKRK